MILVFTSIIVVFWTIWTAICLMFNYARAQKLGVPIVVLPISTMNILWIIVQPTVVAAVERLLGPSNFTRFASRDWHFREKASPHLEFGVAWALVTPGQIWFNVADPDAIVDIFQRRTQFIRPVELYQMLNVFGHNAATVGWSEWKRQRKIISAPFNERANLLVWAESVRQTQDMIKYWTEQGARGNLGLQKDTRTLALNVLAATGFGRTYKFYGSNMARGKDEIGDYREALSILMDNSLFMMLVPLRILRSRFVPYSWAKIGLAAESFKIYMLGLLNQEKDRIKEGKPGASHLTSSLLRSSEEYSKQDLSVSSGPPAKGLTVNELLGNIFLINYAGHDTTANTLAYAIILLAMNPQVQEWVSEEVRAVLGERPYQDWEYGSLFHRLKRPLAVMYETVRLFPPIMALPKYTSGESQQLAIGDSIVNVPSKVYIVPSLLAMHTHPKHWGSDALEWKPCRWIDANDDFLVSKRGTYFPWSEGPQNCPGKKFAQVEFVAVIACLFKSLRVKPVCGPGESMNDAMKRLSMVLEETSHGVLLRMKSADGVRLSWTRTE